MLHAASLAGVAPAECIYVGDAERDVQAAHAAGMPALVALYGYIGAEETPRAWGGEGHLAEPLDLLPWLDASGRYELGCGTARLCARRRHRRLLRC
jgi:N-acetyl-D-muramate 6-phosphate phosphatase